jgi:ACDE family multidrug resistance protein
MTARYANQMDARTVAVGRSPRGPLAQFADGSFTHALTRAAARTVVLLEPDRAPYELTRVRPASCAAEACSED